MAFSFQEPDSGRDHRATGKNQGSKEKPALAEDPAIGQGRA